ncbi:MAG: hypothetical protein GY771_05315 [bacterium]|nr:hypothetical protein [bacterium]
MSTGMPGVEFIDPPSEVVKEKQAPKGDKGKGKKSGLTIAQLESQLKGSFEFLGMLVAGYDEFDSEVIITKAPDLAKALTDLARNNPRVRARLESLLEAGAWGGVIMLVGSQIALPIAVHHNMLPPGMNALIAEQSDIPVKEQGEDEGNASPNAA